MLIGAHVSTSGGLKKALERGREIGAESIQIFPSAPVAWKIKGFSDDDISYFKQEWSKLFKEVVFHGIYLTNLAAQLPENRKKTVTALVDTLVLASKLGINKTIFHPGSYVDGQLGRKDQIIEVLTEVFAQTPPESKLLFENTAGSTIGAKLEELAWLLEVSPADRVGVCLDTCHAFAAGFDMRSLENYQKYIKQVDRLIGVKRVQAWHLNDSKFDLGAKRDRHENVGQGKIGLDPFGYILNDSIWQDTSGYLEVPGFEDKGPDLKNIEILKKMRQ